MTRLQVVGGGRMGEALLAGLLESGWAVPADLTVVERIASRRDELGADFPGVTISETALPTEGAIVAVKPGDVDDACKEIALAGVDRVLSIAAGVTTATLEAALGGGIPVVRAMPNTPAVVGLGASAIAPGASAGDEDLAWASSILEAVGVVVRVKESQLDAVTGLSGSGPAYIFLVAETLIEAGVLMGLTREVAEVLAVQTIRGSGELLHSSDEHAAALRGAVTSPGGTTAAGLHQLELGGVRGAFLSAVQAATERSRDLGNSWAEEYRSVVLVAIGHLAPLPMRSRLQAHLRGTGLELGPGHQPFPVPDGVRVALVDQWVPEDSRALFYELDESVSFPVPDVVANLDIDRLRAVDDESQDFVIASHILEHMAEPVGMIVDIHRVLRPGGVLLALLPDRRRTFDRTRYGTGVDHVVAEHKAGTTVVDDDHIVEFIVHADHLMRRAEGIEPEPLTAELIEAHRLRSIHAHCWTEDEFIDLLLYGVRDLHLGFRLIDGFSARAGRGGWEFGFVMQKTDRSDHDPTEELLDDWAALVARQEVVDRWPVGVVLSLVVQAQPDLSPSEIGAVSDVIDVVLHRPDLQQAFASDALDVDAALGWAARVAAGEITDTSAGRLEPHRAPLARWA